MIPEARLEQTEHGLVPQGEGWFVVNARDRAWRHAEGRAALCSFEGEPQFPQIGTHLSVLEPGQILAMYHWEDDQEDFLVLAGEALLLVEGQERPLRAWDFVHCPARTNHTIVGAGTGPSIVLAVGAREATEEWGAYTVDEAAQRHGAGVQEETADEKLAYAGLNWRTPVRYRDGWLPDLPAGRS
jgi:uncharacterized cupin superfamily protein